MRCAYSTEHLLLVLVLNDYSIQVVIYVTTVEALSNPQQ